VLEVRAQRHARGGQPRFELTHAEVPVEAGRVQDRADDRGLGAAVGQPGGDVVDAAGPARRDDRDVHRVCDRPGDLEVVAGGGAVTIDAVDDDLPGAELLPAPDPLERVEPGRGASSVDEHLVAGRDAGPGADALDLRAEADALAPERHGAVSDDLRVADGHRVDADLLRAHLEDLEHVIDRADPAADREGHEHVAGDPAHGLEVDLALLGAGGDVVEDDLVDLVAVEAGGGLLRPRPPAGFPGPLRPPGPPPPDVDTGGPRPGAQR